jgi:hypothetical protein
MRHNDTMTAKTVRTHAQRTCTVDVSPREVDAGAELTIVVRVSCPHGCDLSGESVSIRNHEDIELARAELAEFDGGAYVAHAYVLRAPLEVGAHTCRAVLAASEKDGVLHDETSTVFAFTTVAHTASVNVWGLPTAIAAGERFSFKVGIKCSAGCELTGQELSIFDHEGAQIAAANLRADVWPGTSALYFADIEAQAPPSTGDYSWQVKTPGSEEGAPHAAGSSAFAVKIVSTPDHEVTVEAFDSENQTPIKGAHVLLHPYRAFTDDRGVAKVKVVKGRYRLVVSGFNYIVYQNIIDVAGDVTTRAELTLEPEGEEDYR